MKVLDKTNILNTIENKQAELRSTHKKLSLPLINRLYKKMARGIKFDAIKVCDSLIIDGHHRYISSLLADVDLETLKSPKTSATIAYDWTEVDFVAKDWDTQDDILHWNHLDAQSNILALEELLELTR